MDLVDVENVSTDNMDAHTVVTHPFLRQVLTAADDAGKTFTDLMAYMDEKSYVPGTPGSREIEIEINKRQKVLIAQLAKLRSLNRRAIQGVRQTKHETTQARQEVDGLHLQLQNLHYEQKHLEGEIHACESYNHKYQQLPLIPVEDFLERFPEHKDTDENDLMIARIAQEHAERQALEEQRQGLLKRKQGLIAENKKRKDDLANLDKDLEKFIDAAKPIEQTFEKEY